MGQWFNLRYLDCFSSRTIGCVSFLPATTVQKERERERERERILEHLQEYSSSPLKQKHDKNTRKEAEHHLRQVKSGASEKEAAKFRDELAKDYVQGKAAPLRGQRRFGNLGATRALRAPAGREGQQRSLEVLQGPDVPARRSQRVSRRFQRIRHVLCPGRPMVVGGK